ncbi:phosphoesterase, partial [Thermococci archaeon]
MKVLILGGGTIGRTLAEALKGEMNITIIEKDDSRAKALIESGFNVVVGDFNYTATLLKAGIDKADLIVITTMDISTIKRATQVIRTNNKEVPIITVIPDEISPEALQKEIEEEIEFEAKFTHALSPRIALSRTIISLIESFAERKNASLLYKKLMELKEKGDSLLIVMHDNPDPDAMASAFALKIIAQTAGFNVKVVYGGEITHHENRAFVNLLGLDLLKVSRGSYEIKRHPFIAIVDCQPNGNVSILEEEDFNRIQILIDHHQILESLKDRISNGAFIDIRPEANSSSAIMVEYLRALNISVDSMLGTALFYGIYTDTKKFSRLSRMELEAVEFLANRINYELLEKIENPDISTEAAEILAKAVLNRRAYKNVLISNVGFITNRDAVPQAADFLLRLEGVSTVLVFGIVDDRIEISARTRDVRVNIGQALKEAFGDIGSAGGHTQMGG